jgi:hypothetical protein
MIKLIVQKPDSRPMISDKVLIVIGAVCGAGLFLMMVIGIVVAYFWWLHKKAETEMAMKFFVDLQEDEEGIESLEEIEKSRSISRRKTLISRDQELIIDQHDHEPGEGSPRSARRGTDPGMKRQGTLKVGPKRGASMYAGRRQTNPGPLRRLSEAASKVTWKKGKGLTVYNKQDSLGNVKEAEDIYSHPKHVEGNQGEDLNFKNLHFDEIIGEGELGDVAQGRYQRDTNSREFTPVSRKMLKEVHRSKARVEMLAELQMMRQLNKHPNVVALIGWKVMPGLCCFVLVYLWLCSSMICKCLDLLHHHHHHQILHHL